MSMDEPTSSAKKSRPDRGLGFILLAVAAGWFGLCAACQPLADSSMFDTTIARTNFLVEWLVTITFWLGWIGTALIVLMACMFLFERAKSE